MSKPVAQLKKGWIAFAFGLCVAAACGAGGPVDVPPPFTLAPDPSWTEPLPVQFDSWLEGRESISDGTRFLLVDNQIRLGPTNACYNHYAFRFLTEAGIRDQATLQVRFDPSYETLQVHRLRLWRGTNVIDCLRKETFRTIQREESLEWRLLDGRLTVVAIPEDVRVGDVMEYAYTLTGDNPVFEGRFTASYLLGWNTPVARMRLRLLVPPDRPLARRLSGQAAVPAPIEREMGARREWLWDLTNTVPVQAESSLPIWFKPLPEVEFSEYNSWADVARWAVAQYTMTGTTEHVLGPQLSEWRQQTGAEDRALAALQFVQDRVRYFGLELGVGSHRPNPPELVLQRRFGDCKDKAALLCMILMDLGIEAYPALVNVVTRQKLSDELPSPSAFNHVIVVAQVDGERYWLDPTNTHQHGRLRDRFLPPYGVALVVKGTTTGLEPIQARGVAGPQTQIHERFTVPDLQAPVQLQVETRYHSRDADSCRARLANTPRADLERQYLNYYAQRYPGAQSDGAVLVQDHVDSNNVVMVSESYRIADFWSTDPEQTNRLTGTFSLKELQPYVQQPSTVLRSMPLGLPFPLDMEQTITVRLPDDWSIEPEQLTISDAFMHFEFVTAYTNRLLTLRGHLRTLADAVPASEVVAHLAKRRQMSASLELTLYHRRPGFPAEAEAAGDGFVFNWPVAVLCAFWCVLLAAGWRRLYGYRPVPPLLPPPDLMKGRAAEPTGLGGWLVLPGIGLVVSPVMLVVNLANLSYCFNAPRWQVLTTPGTAAYHVLWRSMLLFQILGTLFMLAAISLLLVLYFKRRASFPRLMIAFYAMQLIDVAVDYVLAMSIPAVRAEIAESGMRDVSRAVVAASIWIPYFLSSRRVRNTFRE